MPSDFVISDVPRKRLLDLFAQRGTALLNSPQAEAMIRATAYGYASQERALTAAFRAGVPAQMLAMPGMPESALVERLQELEPSLPPEAAAWAIQSWAQALRAASAGSPSSDHLATSGEPTSPPRQDASSMPYYAHASAPPAGPAPSPLAAPTPQVWPPSPAGPPRGASDPPLFENTSGMQTTVPPEIAKRKWSWGAAFIPVFWLGYHNLGIWAWAVFLFNSVSRFIPSPYVLWLFVIQVPVTIYLGLTGNALAWKNRRYESVEHFNEVEKRWTIGGVLGCFLLIGLFAAGMYLATPH